MTLNSGWPTEMKTLASKAPRFVWVSGRAGSWRDWEDRTQTVLLLLLFKIARGQYNPSRASLEGLGCGMSRNLDLAEWRKSQRVVPSNRIVPRPEAYLDDPARGLIRDERIAFVMDHVHELTATERRGLIRVMAWSAQVPGATRPTDDDRTAASKGLKRLRDLARPTGLRDEDADRPPRKKTRRVPKGRKPDMPGEAIAVWKT